MSISRFIPLIFLLLAGVAGWMSLRNSKALTSIESPHYLVTFEDPEFTQLSTTVLEARRPYQIEQHLDTFVTDPHFIAYQSPIKRRIQAYQIKLTDGRQVWCSPVYRAIAYQDDPQTPLKWRLEADVPWDLRFLPPVFLCLAAIAALICRMNASTGIQWQHWLMFPLARLALLFLFFTMNGCFVIYTSDESMFVDIAREWLAGSRQTPIPGGIGTAFFYAPLVLIGGVETFWDVALAASWCNTLIIGTANLLLVLLLAQKFNPSRRVFYATGLIATLFPFLVYVVRMGDVSDPNFIGKTVFHLLQHDPYAVNLYYWSLLNHWNGLSDNIAAAFILLCIYLTWRMPLNWRRYLALGLCLGFAITVRHASVAMLPLIYTWDIARQIKAGFSAKKFIAWYFVFGMAGILGCLPQLIDNWTISGNPLQATLTEKLFEGGDTVVHLFGLDNLVSGYHYFFQIHFKTLVLFVIVLLCLKPSVIRLGFWVWLMVPMTFVCLLNFYSVQSVRYLLIIYPALFLAIGLICDRLNNRESAVSVATVVICFTLTSPEEPLTWAPVMLPLWQMRVLLAILAALILALTYKARLRRHVGLTLVAFILIFTSGAWQVPLITAWAVLLTFLPKRRLPPPVDGLAPAASEEPNDDVGCRE